jgi:hypothetical protein
MEFLSLRENLQMKKELKKILEDLPEGILIHNSETKEIMLSNTELRRLFKVTSGKTKL